MEQGSCSRNPNRRAEVGSESHLNVSSDESNGNKEVVNVEGRRSSNRRQQFRYSNNYLAIINDENGGHGDDDYGCVINERGSNSAQKRRKSSSTLRARGLMIQETQKRSIVSWLIDSGTVRLDENVCCMTWIGEPLSGKITTEGILCNCCQTIFTISGFEAHSGVITGLPYMNMFIGSKKTSLFHCQLTAWGKLRESCIYYRPLKNYEGDSSDDTCGVCGDGGDLICCDACPSTFHQNCLGIEVIPQGNWYCPLCLCKYCGLLSVRDERLLLTCRQCEQKYHPVCAGEEKSTCRFDHNGFAFCGKSCSQLFELLQNLVGIKIPLGSGIKIPLGSGIKIPLGSGITWSLIRSFDYDLITFGNDLYERMQYNSTLAAALAVMEECFDPITDCRTGINVIQHIICNNGSNIRRLNFGGFYTAVLERDDEILSVASIRFHGTRLAEMPFICTRNKYRCQGLCRCLLNAVESTLCTFGVKRIIIPSISERVHKWINSYGFQHIEQPLKKHMRNINLLTFPETVQLQKVLFNNSANRVAPATGDVRVRISNRLLIPLPFDLNQPSEEDESAKNEELHGAPFRPTHGGFIAFNPHDGTLRYQRVRL